MTGCFFGRAALREEGDPGPGADPGGAEQEPFAALSPDAILNAIDAAIDSAVDAAAYSAADPQPGARGIGPGIRTSGQVLALNSYENRVFQVGLESNLDAPAPAPLIVKFYRPGRWTDAQILEEHSFLEELAHAEVPAVAPLRHGGTTLLHSGGFRFALFERRGGRTPELSDPSVRERIGRFLGRLHVIGARAPFAERPRLDVHTFGEVPSRYLLENEWLPADLAPVYRGCVEHALDAVRTAFSSAGTVRFQRVHGDCHPGNLLWSDTGSMPGPHFVDFDDSAMAPAVQDLWMLLSGERADAQAQLRDVLRGYEQFASFDRSQLGLIEPLRTLRLIHYAAWIARRWSDPAFPAAFPWFRDSRYWEARVLELREQLAAMQEPALEP